MTTRRIQVLKHQKRSKAVPLTLVALAILDRLQRRHNCGPSVVLEQLIRDAEHRTDFAPYTREREEYAASLRRMR